MPVLEGLDDNSTDTEADHLMGRPSDGKSVGLGFCPWFPVRCVAMLIVFPLFWVTYLLIALLSALYNRYEPPETAFSKFRIGQFLAL